MKSRSFLTIALVVVALIFEGITADQTKRQDDELRVELQAPIPEHLLSHHGWSITSKRATPTTEVTFFVELRTGKEGEVEKVAAAVSDPKSPSYGKFLSAEELRSLVAAPPEVEHVVLQWLGDESAANGDQPISSKSYGDLIMVTTTVQNAELLFDTEIAEFTHAVTGRSVQLIVQPATVSLEISHNVRGLVGLSDVSVPRHFASYRVTDDGQVESRTLDRRQSSAINPSNLRTRYNVSSSLFASSSVSQAVVSFNDLFSTRALQTFSTYNSMSTPTVTTIYGTGSNVPCTSYACSASGESDLDIQYITAMARNADHRFHLNDNAGWSTYYWAVEVTAATNPAMVYSMSWGSDEVTSTGGQWGDTASTESQLAKVAARGISVFVASGDNGAAGGSEACPLDTTKYCYRGGCAHTTTACGQILVGGKSFPSSGSNSFSSAQLTTITTFLNAQSGCNAAIETDYDGYQWLYSTCPCSSFVYGTVGTLRFKNYATTTSAWVKMLNSYAATSAWTTAVGATEWPSGSDVDVVGSNEGLSIITSGGGFSYVATQPWWQAAQVTAYLAQSGLDFPPTTAYNANGRGYPDVSLLGHNYRVSYGGSSGTSTPYWAAFDGTSASTPAFAGLITLINQMRISAGKAQLGFLNPALYQMATERPSAFTDVVSGTNKATMGYVCQYGWAAAPGWDAATGLGVPNFGIMADYLLHFDDDTASPSPSPSPTPSISSTPSPSISSTPSPSLTSSPSPLITPSATPTPSSTTSTTPSPSRTSSPSPSTSTSRSATPSASRTTTPSSSPTRSVSPTNSASPSQSSTTSATPTISSSPSPSPSTLPTLSPSGSITPSASASLSPSQTKTPASSNSQSPSATRTPSGSPTPSPSTSLSPSTTRSPTPSPSGAPSRSPTRTPSRSPARTPSPSRSPPRTPSPSRTAFI